jgi:hypothetical protein
MFLLNLATHRMEITAEVRRVRPNQALQRSVQERRFAPLLTAR